MATAHVPVDKTRSFCLGHVYRCASASAASSMRWAFDWAGSSSASQSSVGWLRAYLRHNFSIVCSHLGDLPMDTVTSPRTVKGLDIGTSRIVLATLNDQTVNFT